MTDLSLVLAGELISSSKTPFLTHHALSSLSHTPRNTSGNGFPSTPTSCLNMCCTVHQTVITPFTSRSPKTWTNFYLLIPTLSSSYVVNLTVIMLVGWVWMPWDFTCHGTSGKDFCDSLGLTQSVNFPTRISANGTPSLLDLILTDFPENICCSFFFSN